jgi:hypothetical protein
MNFIIVPIGRSMACSREEQQGMSTCLASAGLPWWCLESLQYVPQQQSLPVEPRTWPWPAGALKPVHLVLGCTGSAAGITSRCCPARP